jgi:hypothetical protein
MLPRFATPAARRSQTLNFIIWAALLAYPILFTWTELLPSNGQEEPDSPVEEERPTVVVPSGTNPFSQYPGLLKQHWDQNPPKSSQWASPDAQGDKRFYDAVARIASEFKSNPLDTQWDKQASDVDGMTSKQWPYTKDTNSENSAVKDLEEEIDQDFDEPPPLEDEELESEDPIKPIKRPIKKPVKKPIEPDDADDEGAEEPSVQRPSDQEPSLKKPSAEEEPTEEKISTKINAVKQKILDKLSSLETKYPQVYKSVITDEPLASESIAELKSRFTLLRDAIKTHIVKQLSIQTTELTWVPPPPKNQAHAAPKRIWTCALADASRKIKHKGTFIAVDDRPLTPITLYSFTNNDVWSAHAQGEFVPACLSYDGKRCLYSADVGECNSFGPNAPASRAGLLVCPQVDSDDMPLWCFLAKTYLPLQPNAFLAQSSQFSEKLAESERIKSEEEEERITNVLVDKFGDQSQAGIPETAPPPTPPVKKFVKASMTFKCLPGHNTPITLVKGNPACASRDNKSCLWLSSAETCALAIGNHVKDPRGKARFKYVIECGKQHEALFGWTGFDGKEDYWCATAKKAL